MGFPHGERVRLENPPVDRMPWVEGLGYVHTHVYLYVCLSYLTAQRNEIMGHEKLAIVQTITRQLSSSIFPPTFH